MSMPSIDEIARFCGADADADGAVLQACYAAAVAWYSDAQVPEDTEGELYKFWVLYLTSWFFDNIGGDKPIPPIVVTSVHQLRPKRGEPN